VVSPSGRSCLPELGCSKCMLASGALFTAIRSVPRRVDRTFGQPSIARNSWWGYLRSRSSVVSLFWEVVPSGTRLPEVHVSSGTRREPVPGGSAPASLLATVPEETCTPCSLLSSVLPSDGYLKSRTFGVFLSWQTVAGRDARIEPPWMGSRRVGQERNTSDGRQQCTTPRLESV
jgi:hypothetical protein